MDSGHRRCARDRRCLLSGQTDDDAEQLNRRDALRKLGTGGFSLLGAGVIGAVAGNRAAQATVGEASRPDGEAYSSHGQASDSSSAGRMSEELPVGATAGPYGGPFAPPDGLAADATDHLLYPPPPTDGPVELAMSVVEKPIEVSRAHTVEAWTYNGTAPGPTIRATEGERITINFTNKTDHDHNLHFHGRHSPLHDGWEPIPPGGEATYEITAGPAGVHPYHCHTMPIDQHIAKGLYGTLIVDPVVPRPPATEIVLALSGWDPPASGQNHLYAWNGIAGFYLKFPIKVPAGERVRAYVLNMVEYDPIASFHLHAEMFDVYPSGAGQEPAQTADIISLGQMERAVVEFTLSERGRYLFHPHQHSIAARGAMGWLAAI